MPFNPVALRKAKIVYNVGLSECNKVNNYTWHNKHPNFTTVFTSASEMAGPNSAVYSGSDSRARGPMFEPRSGHIHSFLLPLIQEGQICCCCIVVLRPR